ncbi:MAG: VanZ family protein [Candidatus Electrothrix aestuarii]|uniref:VanZ family protein n=1 Tax=Candidatus Electrothrix aestuarii TaxID=3062594 RepID=A0AAU8LSL6_9BACT
MIDSIYSITLAYPIKGVQRAPIILHHPVMKAQNIPLSVRISLTTAYLLCIYCTLGIARPIAEYLRSTGILFPTVIALFTLCLPFALFWRYKTITRTRFLMRILLILCLLCAAFLTAALPEERLHFLTYGFAGWLICWSLEATSFFSTPSQKNKILIWLVPCLLVWLAGGTDELIQWWLPNRVFDVRDIIFNATAGITGIALFATGGRTMLTR